MLPVYFKSLDANDAQDLFKICRIVTIYLQSWSVVNVINHAGWTLTWLIEFAAHEARPVPREATRKVRGSKGTGAIA